MVSNKNIKNILVVDDKDIDLNHMKSILVKEGYKVTIASDGAKALDVLEGNNFDLLIIDIKLPTLSGYDLLRLMRERLNHSIPMIFVSIVPERDIDMSDVDGFIQKPFSLRDFIRKVNNVMVNFKNKKD